MRTVSLAGLLGSLALAAPAGAQELAYYEVERERTAPSVELALDVGLLDRGTTGIGEPLLGLGYDHGGGLSVGAGARAYFHIDQYFRHGLHLRLSHQAGSALGLVGDHGFAWSQLDLAYVFRTQLPCLSDEEQQWYLSGLAGLSGAHADASTGDAPPDERWNERVAASESLDHHALGALLGVGLDLHLGPWLVGALLEVREVFAIGDAAGSRSFLTSATMRAGIEIGP